MTGIKITTSDLTMTMTLTSGKDTGALIALKRLWKSNQLSIKLSTLEPIFTKDVHTETTPQTPETAQLSQALGSLSKAIAYIQITNSMMEQSGLLISKCRQVKSDISKFSLTGQTVLLMTGLLPPGESLAMLQ